ncbi:hypothetical protein N0V93_000938 [Gnomoniopsis smithogilvyi]|uniref:Uncharacterized protein n=1 Tax=Gnomoniopsis smithogilvyi TaxID=1191159 RepID=A0A9W8Z4Z3_9PEZI|nr:hypothetical protein N0V93_000938 [Gnomoniopsis smithogilvyi]
MDGNDIVMTYVCGLVLVSLIALVVWQSIIYRRLYVDDYQADIERGRSLRRSSQSKFDSHPTLLQSWEQHADDIEDYEDREAS